MMRTSIGWLAVSILGAVVVACSAAPSVENSSTGSDTASSEGDNAAGSEGSAGAEATGSSGSGSSSAASSGSGGGGAGNVPDCSKPEVVCPLLMEGKPPMSEAACSCVTTKPCSYEICGEPSPKGIFLATCDGKTWSIQETPCQ
jgi:hypothetical protein